MCTHCGCSPHSHEHDHSHSHDHFSHHPHTSEHEKISIEEHILSHNEAHALENKAYFEKNHIFVLNLVSSPGSGKTTLIAQTAQFLGSKAKIQVVVGDQETEHDANRLRKHGLKAEQIQTGKGCHLDAHGIGHALEHLQPENNSLLFIENVGNLVCPTDFNLGENVRVVLLSLTEGEDKPLKYPHIFASAQVLLITKTDLAPYLSCSIENCMENALKVNPNLKVFCISNTTQEGFSQWTDYLLSHLP